MSCLRITTSSGEVVCEPDRATMAATIANAGRLGRGAFVVLDGSPDGYGPFLQATRIGTPSGTAWRVEVWRVAGHGTRERYQTLAADDAAVTDTFWSWTTGSDEWRRLRWHQVAGTTLATAG